jgi:hypothetical protein
MRAAGAAVVAAALLLVTGAAAVALPGDPPIVPLGPADGATVAAGDVQVRYACPVYRISDPGPGFTQYGDVSDYGVELTVGTCEGFAAFTAPA